MDLNKKNAFALYRNKFDMTQSSYKMTFERQEHAHFIRDPNLFTVRPSGLHKP